MKIAMLHGPQDLRIEDHPLDTTQLAADEIHVETIISALKIGTDRGNFEGAAHVPGAPGYPRWVGDSNLGEVRAVGSDVTRVQVGDRIVTRQPHQSEYIMRESASLTHVPAGIDPEDAVFAHLYALSGLCYRKAFFQPGGKRGGCWGWCTWAGCNCIRPVVWGAGGCACQQRYPAGNGSNNGRSCWIPLR